MPRADGNAGGDIPGSRPGLVTQYLLSGLVSEARRHGVSYGRIAELVATNPARRYGRYGVKGDLPPGYDADVVLLDPDASPRPAGCRRPRIDTTSAKPAAVVPAVR